VAAGRCAARRKERKIVRDLRFEVNGMNTRTFLIASTVAFLPVTGALAAERDTRDGTEVTAASVAALKASVGNSAGLEVDEVRVTDDGIACIDYRTSNSQGRKSPGHAIVQGNEVLKSSSGDERFEKAWTKHCLGPRGGMSGGMTGGGQLL
jgi:hypothetical protein